jgi:NADH-quinone oxidoreductase subunit G
MIVQTAPSVRVSLGELFGDPVGYLCTGKMVAAARALGFKYVLDTNFGADGTVIEEATELLHRFEHNEILPQFTSCCPAWVNFVERLHPELIPHLSSTKSPHMIAARLIKTYFCERVRIKPENAFLVSVMPCTAKKDEIKRLQHIGDVNAVLTVREFGHLIKEFGIEWVTLPEDKFDDLMGESSGAAAIFGVTGGVAEATVRYAHQLVTGNALGPLTYEELRGSDSIKTADVTIGSRTIKIAVCNGSGAAAELIDSQRYRQFDFIEVMACRGGCAVGGGQPRLPDRKLAVHRARSIYGVDTSSQARISSGNSQLSKIYEVFLGRPGGEKAEALLHTHYEPQESASLSRLRRAQQYPTVGFATTGGTAIRLARMVAGFLGTYSVPCNSLIVASVARRKTAVFVIATTGEGEFPMNCRRFVNDLRDATVDMSNLQCAVLGLGSSEFPMFARAGEQLDSLLKEKGATPILPFTALDSSAEDGGLAVFEKWARQLCAALNLKAPRLGLHLLYSTDVDKDDTVETFPMNPIGFEIASLKSRAKLTDDMTVYTIKLPAGVKYLTGFTADILATNAADKVNAVLDAIKIPPNEVYKISVNNTAIQSYIPEKVTAHQLFTQYLDVSSSPTHGVLRAFLNVADDEGTLLIAGLLDPSKAGAFDQFTAGKDIAAIIVELSRYGIPHLDALISSCPHILPERFPISSKSNENQSVLEIVAERGGLISEFLDRADTKKLAINLGLPPFGAEEGAPVIFAASGVGFAGIKPLIESRYDTSSPALVIYECQDSKLHAPLVAMLNDFKDRSLIKDLIVSYQDKGESIQDILTAQHGLIWEYWKDAQSPLFCQTKDDKFPAAIKAALVQATATGMKTSHGLAQAFFENHCAIVSGL